MIETIGYGVLKDPLISAKSDGSKPLNKDIIETVNFNRRNLRNDDVLIDIEYCGVCHSDWHTMLNEWKHTHYPTITGHEITGIVSDIGSQVIKFKVGDRVAAGPTYNSCRTCPECHEGHEQYCEKGTTEIYNMHDREVYDLDKPTGPITYGGYSNLLVINENYVIKVPDNISLDVASPILCAGVTTYTPFKYNKIGKGHKVGVAGIGGLGHMAIKFAKMLGAEVIALTRTPWKIEDSIRLGADDSVLVTDINHPSISF
jgi:uncharacterized zinc-type alcohol dehydrogenase-like protein